MGEFLSSEEGKRFEALFWDFASLPQKGAQGEERSKEDLETFKKGLVAMAPMYASAWGTTVLIQPKMPTDVTKDYYLRPYGERGWCLFEKHSAQIGMGTSRKESTAGSEERANRFGRFVGLPAPCDEPRCQSEALPKLYDIETKQQLDNDEEAPDPESFRKLLDAGYFTGKGDKDVVFGMYSNFYLTIGWTETLKTRLFEQDRTARDRAFVFRAVYLGGGSFLLFFALLVMLTVQPHLRGAGQSLVVMDSICFLFMLVGAWMVVLSVQKNEGRLVMMIARFLHFFVYPIAAAFFLLRFLGETSEAMCGGISSIAECRPEGATPALRAPFFFGYMLISVAACVGLIPNAWKGLRRAQVVGRPAGTDTRDGAPPALDDTATTAGTRGNDHAPAQRQPSRLDKLLAGGDWAHRHDNSYHRFWLAFRVYLFSFFALVLAFELSDQFAADDTPTVTLAVTGILISITLHPDLRRKIRSVMRSADDEARIVISKMMDVDRELATRKEGEGLQLLPLNEEARQLLSRAVEPAGREASREAEAEVEDVYRRLRGCVPRLRQLRKQADFGAPHSFFVSHSDHPDGDRLDARLKALVAWAERYEETQMHEPLVWVDFVCKDSDDHEWEIQHKEISELPLVTSGCQGFLLLAGAGYRQQLRCIFELFCFLRLQGDLNRVVVLPLRQDSFQLESMFEGFDVNETIEARERSSRSSRTARGRGLHHASSSRQLLVTLEASFGNNGSFHNILKQLVQRPPEAPRLPPPSAVQASGPRASKRSPVGERLSRSMSRLLPSSKGRLSRREGDGMATGVAVGGKGGQEALAEGERHDSLHA